MSQVNAEDTLFAGAVLECLKESFDPGNDSALISRDLYKLHKHDLFDFLKTTSHFQRLARLNIHKDILFCLQHSIYEVLPRLEGNTLIA